MSGVGGGQYSGAPVADGGGAAGARPEVWCSRLSATFRTSDTCRASTLTPGSSTRLRRNQPTAWSNSALGPSACVQARPCRNVRNRRDHSASSYSWYS